MSMNYGGRVALGARFAGLGIAAFASFAIMTTAPAAALANEEGDPHSPEGNTLLEGPSQDGQFNDANEEGTDGSGGDAQDGALGGGDASGSNEGGAEGSSENSDSEISQLPAEGENTSTVDGDPTKPGVGEATDPANNTQLAGDAATQPTHEASVPASQTGAAADAAKKAQSTSSTPKKNSSFQAQSDDSNWEQGHWEVRKVGSSLQRFWIGKDGKVYISGLVRPEWGLPGKTAGYWAYARGNGWIVRGKWDDGKGHVYIADNDGRLPNKDGWLVTGIYDGGTLQRYFIENHYAKTSYFQAKLGGKTSYFYGLGGRGYVLRDASSTNSGLSIGNNDGRLHSGWAVTSAFGHGLQRYWFNKNGIVARNRVISAEQDGSGFDAYARAEGYVVRGSYRVGNRAYLANNDGKLESKKNGWLVTAAYNKGTLARYYMRNGLAIVGHYVVSDDGSYISNKPADAGNHYFAGSAGAVFIGANAFGGGTLISNNDGKLYWKTGWLVTGAYTGGSKQRYYFDSTTAPGGIITAKRGLFTVNKKKYLGTYRGYVMRNDWDVVGDKFYNADNDGVLTETKATLTASQIQARALANDTLHRYGSKTDYLITVSQDTCTFYLWKRSATNNCNLIFSTSCTVGADGTPTWSGTTETFGPRLRWFSGAAWATPYREGYHLHSTILGIPDSAQLGRRQSHGCIRIPERYAKFVYEKVPLGTRFYVYGRMSSW